MKKLILFLAATGIIFSSCNGKYTIAKRKYNKGFYVSRSSGNDSKTNVTSINKTIKVSHTENIQQEIVLVPKNEVLKTENSITEPVLTKSFTSTEKNNRKITAKPNEIASTDAKPVLETKVIKSIDVTKKETKNTSGSGSDVNKILLIILCIFIPPLAVFLFDNKLSTNFWIDLILTFLFFLPGIVFAFLVCFGGVSL